MGYIKIYENPSYGGQEKKIQTRKNIQRQEMPGKMPGKSCLDLFPKYFTESLP